MDSSVAAVIESILKKDIGSLAKWNLVQAELLKHGYAYQLDNVHVSKLMVHPENRGGLGFNPSMCIRLAKAFSDQDVMLRFWARQQPLKWLWEKKERLKLPSTKL
jgi:hypothetical protein